MMTWLRARDLTAKTGSRKVAHETWLKRDAVTDDVHVRYHSTAVVTIHEDDTYTLRTGGWFTKTTKKRIEDFSPVWIHGKTEPYADGEWMVHSVGAAPVEFEEGMRVDWSGWPLDFTSEVL